MRTNLLIAVACLALGLTGCTEGEEGTTPSPEPRPPVVSVQPQRVQVGDTAELVVHRAPGTYGLAWTFEVKSGSAWRDAGMMKGGPGRSWTPEFFIGEEPGTLVIEDIGFNGPASMTLEIPAVEPGFYRLGQGFINDDLSKSLEDRKEWHYAEFEIVAGPTPTPTQAQGTCGSDQPTDGAKVSERDAVYTAFPKLTHTPCDRFATKLHELDGRLTWDVVASEPDGCSETRYVDAKSGELLPEGAVMCP